MNLTQICNPIDGKGMTLFPLSLNLAASTDHTGVLKTSQEILICTQVISPCLHVDYMTLTKEISHVRDTPLH